MRDRLAALIAALRTGGLPVSVAEAIDAAATATTIGIERARLADGLAAALVKDEADRPLFDECFARVFPALLPASAGKGRRHRARPAVAGKESGGGGGAAGGSVSREAAHPRAAGEDDARGRADREPSRRRAPDASGDSSADRDRRAHLPDARGGTSSSPEADTNGPQDEATRHSAARMRTLRTKPFASMSPRDVEDAALLVRTLARRVSTRLRRRLRPRRTGRLDFRRTLRAATSRGGTPVERHFRGRRPRRPALVALCDLSASVASATDFLLALLAPARAYFSSVRLFGFVDRLVEIEFVAGTVRPAAPIDLMARSDFGRVLRDLMERAAHDLTADTVLLLLGDARNNRRPPRADVLKAARARVRHVVWLNPEPPERWNTGDSVMSLYARSVDVVVACGSLAQLAVAIGEIGRS